MITPDQLKNLFQIFTPANLDAYQFVSRLINLFILAAGMIAVVFLIYAGVLFITAGGRTEQAQKAQRAAINVIIGMILIASSYLIVYFVGKIFGQLIS